MELLAVQDLDTTIDQLRHRRGHLDEAVVLAKTEAEIAALAKERTAKSAERDKLTAAEHALEADDAALTKKVADLESKLSKTIVPKEAETFQMEIKAVKAQRSLLEDRELELLEAIDPIEQRLAAIDTAVVEFNARADEQRAAFTAAAALIDADLAEATARRQTAAAAIPADTLARYDKLRPKFGGVAIARIEHSTCSGCHMKIPAKEFEAMRAAPAGSELNCEQCGRIVVLA
jgi:uncharacterized protein